MLILTRRPGEAVIIGRDAEIEVRILGIKGNQVRVGVTAEKGTPVHREEIHERIQAEREAATNE